MKRITPFFVIMVVSILLGACDYWSWFDFKIINSTGDSITLSYLEQMHSFTSINNTPGYEDEYMSIRLKEMATDTVIAPGQTFVLDEVGPMCNMYFPEGLEDPKEWGIVPLWERIVAITIKGDTLNPEIYSRELWYGKGSTYTLAIKEYMYSDEQDSDIPVVGRWQLIKVDANFGGTYDYSMKNIEYQFLNGGVLKVSDDGGEDGFCGFLKTGEHQYALDENTSMITIDGSTYAYRFKDKELIIDTGSAWDAPVYVFKRKK